MDLSTPEYEFLSLLSSGLLSQEPLRCVYFSKNNLGCDQAKHPIYPSLGSISPLELQTLVDLDSGQSTNTFYQGGLY